MIKTLSTGAVREVGIVSYGNVQAFSNSIKSRISTTGTIIR